MPRWGDVSLWVWVPSSGFACSLHCQEALWRWLDTVYLHKAGCCKNLICLEQSRSWQGDVFSHPMFEWEILEKQPLFGAMSTHFAAIPQPPSMPVWQPEKCFFSCDTALGTDLGSRRCSRPPLWVSQEVFLLEPLGMMRWRAAGLWHGAHVPIAVAFQEGASGSALQVLVLLARVFSLLMSLWWWPWVGTMWERSCFLLAKSNWGSFSLCSAFADTNTFAFPLWQDNLTLVCLALLRETSWRGRSYLKLPLICLVHCFSCRIFSFQAMETASSFISWCWMFLKFQLLPCPRWSYHFYCFGCLGRERERWTNQYSPLELGLIFMNSSCWFWNTIVSKTFNWLRFFFLHSFQQHLCSAICHCWERKKKKRK